MLTTDLHNLTLDDLEILLDAVGDQPASREGVMPLYQYLLDRRDDLLDDQMREDMKEMEADDKEADTVEEEEEGQVTVYYFGFQI